MIKKYILTKEGKVFGAYSGKPLGDSFLNEQKEIGIDYIESDIDAQDLDSLEIKGNKIQKSKSHKNKVILKKRRALGPVAYEIAIALLFNDTDKLQELKDKINQIDIDNPLEV